MKLRKIKVEACGCLVALDFKPALDVRDDKDVFTILDRHARQIENELTSAAPEVLPFEGAVDDNCLTTHTQLLRLTSGANREDKP
jgi:hypothetical protein